MSSIQFSVIGFGRIGQRHAKIIHELPECTLLSVCDTDSSHFEQREPLGFPTLLSDENHLQMYVPPGFAHGFCVLSDVADFVYKCTDYYNPSDESGIIWNDTTLNIKWPIKNPIISDKDRRLITFNKLSANG